MTKSYDIWNSERVPIIMNWLGCKDCILSKHYVMMSKKGAKLVQVS